MAKTKLTRAAEIIGTVMGRADRTAHQVAKVGVVAKKELAAISKQVEALTTAGTSQFPEWQRQFEALLCESDWIRLPERLQAAKAAIFSRLRAKREHPPGTLERIALNDAIHLLRVLRSEGVTQALPGQES